MREVESGGVEEEESGTALRRMFKPTEEEGKDVKEDREEQGSWEEKVANSIEQRCEFDCVSVGELRAFGDWRGCLFCVCAWFGVNKCVVLLDSACCVYHKGSGSHVQHCPRPCSSTHR